MSKTASVSFRQRNLWAYDVSLSILLAELIEVITCLDPGERPQWLTGLLPDFRRHAVVGADLHLDLDLGLTDQQRDHLLELIAQAGQRLRERKMISAAEAAEWEVLDGHAVIWRSAAAVDTSAIADLGGAVIALVQGTLPDPPQGAWWLFGMPGGLQTLAMDVDHLG
jgi:hypothetical protein